MADETSLVFFDLEATGLDTTVCDIIQLSALSGDRDFNVYIFPQVELTDSAKRVTGFTVRDKSLLLRGEPVVTIPLHQALTSFIAFLRTFKSPVALVAHGAKRFDAPLLARSLQKCGLKREFQQVVSGLVDTFLLCKNLFPYQLASFAQVSLVKHFLGKSYNAHNALEDSRALQELYRKWNPSSQQRLRCTFQLPRVY
ncbi:DNA polymerase III subunit epsilon [Genypterus blacodes]|uniref:DNA polymerase III subunit epsilon n=1 Tax=Genypterus blacodes TaxID=154954 RepID=UPI003F76791B